MKKLTVFLLICLLVACSDNESSSSAGGGAEFYNGLITLSSYFGSSEILSYQPDGPVIDTILEIQLPSTRYSLSFYRGPDCNYDAATIRVDGRVIEKEYSFFYGNDSSLKIMVPDYTNEHVIELTMDSTLCGAYHGKYRLIPSKKPGEYTIPSGDGYANDYSVILTYSTFKKGTLFFDVVGGIQWAQDWEYRFAFGDSVQSDCILEKEGDTLHLPISFVASEDPLRYPEARVDAEEDKILKFMGEDTVGSVACAMVYQSWVVPREVDSLVYKTKKKVNFVQKFPDHLEEDSCEDNAFCFKGEIARLSFFESEYYYNQNSYVIAKTTEGNFVYRKEYLGWCSPDSGRGPQCRYIFYKDDLPINAAGDTLGFEYLQLVAIPHVVSSRESKRIQNELESMDWGYNMEDHSWLSNQDSAQKIDSLINLLVNEKGDPRDGIWMMAKRINSLSN